MDLYSWLQDHVWSVNFSLGVSPVHSCAFSIQYEVPLGVEEGTGFQKINLNYSLLTYVKKTDSKIVEIVFPLTTFWL
jgi:hypothetical protein